LIRTLVNANLPGGIKSVHWDGKDRTDHKVSEGIYFLKLEAESKIAIQKMIFLR
jgi:hypothetical protein